MVSRVADFLQVEEFKVDKQMIAMPEVELSWINTTAVESIPVRLYKMLYGIEEDDDDSASIARVASIIREQDPKVGICTKHWGSNEIAFRCANCETDENCVICPPCYFASNHEGHRVKLIRTGDGCCDCGDELSWKKEGFCPDHGQPLTMELGRSTIERLTQDLQENAQMTLAAVVEYADHLLEVLVKKEICARSREANDTTDRIDTMLRWLTVVGRAFVGFRFLIIDSLMALGEAENTRAYRWLCMNHRLHSNYSRQKCSHAIYDLIVTLVQTSREFKIHVAWCYIHNYGDLTHASTRNHYEGLTSDIGSLSVQLFTIEEVIVALKSPGDPIGMCFYQIAGELIKTLASRREKITVVEDGVSYLRTTLNFGNPLGLQIDMTVAQIIHELRYILHINPLATAFLFLDDQVKPARKMFCAILECLWKTSIQVRRKTDHIGTDETHPIPAFQVETMLSHALSHLTNICREPARTFEELKGWYTYLRDALIDRMGKADPESSLDNMSFHILFLRFFVRCINWDIMMTDLDEGREKRWLDLFPVPFLHSVLLECCGPLSFHFQINAHAWVRNGEEHMYSQVAIYEGRNTGGFAATGSARNADIAGAQFAMILLGAHKENATRCLLESLLRVNISQKDKKYLAQAVKECTGGIWAVREKPEKGVFLTKSAYT